MDVQVPFHFLGQHLDVRLVVQRNYQIANSFSSGQQYLLLCAVGSQNFTVEGHLTCHCKAAPDFLLKS